MKTVLAKPRTRTMFQKHGWQITLRNTSGHKRLIVEHKDGFKDFPIYGTNNQVYYAFEDEIPYWVREQVKETYRDIL